METNYVLDACALIAFLYDESGAEVVQEILENAKTQGFYIYMNKVNLYEVYYNVHRAEGDEQAEIVYSTVQKLPINIVSDFSDDAFREAAKIKGKYKMSMADSIALGEAIVRNAIVVTADHHELDAVDEKESINFAWIR